LDKYSNVVGLGSHGKGRYGDRQKTHNMKAFDIPTPEELIQKL
jgi:hypothetical protein